MSNTKRKFVDCREMPSDKNCSVRISGSEDEVLIVAARHSVEEHGHKDTTELRNEIKKALKDEVEA